MLNILDVANNKLIGAEIIAAELKTVPLIKEGWEFNWRQLAREKDGHTFILKTTESPQSVEGALLLKIGNEMLIMDTLEIVPHNIGRANKKYDYVAGCLIAFACRESFKLEGAYQGYLTFFAKTNLIQWYIDKYDAEVASGQQMFIDSETGIKLINEYLK